MKIKAVFFDLDGTLFNRDSTVAGIVDWQVREFSSVIPAERASEFRSKVATLDDHGHRDKRDVYALVGVDFDLEPPTVEHLIDTFWSEYPRHCKADDDVIDTLRVLRQRGTRLGIITNGATVVQNLAIDAIGVRALMNAILVSETEGLRKPDSEIFQRAATRVGLTPVDCCFVGDHPAIDVAGAEDAGFFGVWKRTSYWAPHRKVPTIDRLSELAALV